MTYSTTSVGRCNGFAIWSENIGGSPLGHRCLIVSVFTPNPNTLELFTLYRPPIFLFLSSSEYVTSYLTRKRNFDFST